MTALSRLGLHVIQPTAFIVNEIERAAKAGVPLRMVKCVDFPGLIEDVFRVSPATLVMWRATGLDNPDGGEYTDDQDLDKLAERLLLHHLTRLGDYTRYASRIILEVLNEPDPPTPRGYYNLGRLIILLMQKASARGLKIAAPALNFGTPATWEKLFAFVSTGVFQVAHNLGHWITFHEGVDSGWEVDHDWGDPIPGFPFRLDNSSPYNTRYRYAVEAARRHGNVPPNVAITEWYTGENTLAEQIVSDVNWYDRQVRNNPYVFTFMLFTNGAFGGWEHGDRDYDPVLSSLIDYVIAQGVDGGEQEMATFTENTEEELNRSVEMWKKAGFTLVSQRVVYVAEMKASQPEPPPVPPFYTMFEIGTHLRVVRQDGLMVYLNSELTQPWSRGKIQKGDTSMTLAFLYDATLDPLEVGVLCVLKPSTTFPKGLWIAAVGNDEMPNVEKV